MAIPEQFWNAVFVDGSYGHSMNTVVGNWGTL